MTDKHGEEESDIYRQLEIEPFINAAGTYTVAGGSRMSEQTLQAMAAAARQHVDIPELQQKVQRKLAEMTHNQAACVCNGAAAGLYLCTLAAVALKYGKEARHLTKEQLSSTKIVALSAHHIPYDHAVGQTGVQQVFVGYPNIPDSTSIADLAAAIDCHTAAIFFFLSSPYGERTPGALPLEHVIQLAREQQLPLIVDAAAQLPPPENLWRFTEMGATAAIFSGGKDLRGPQSSGLILGRRPFLEMVQRINFPNYGFGRMLKTGREEIVGLYHAVKQYLAMDHRQRSAWAEEMVSRLIASLAGSTLYHAQRCYPNEAGQDLPYVKVSVPGADVLDIARELLQGRPSILVKPIGECFYINPMTITEAEVSVVEMKLKQIEQQRGLAPR